MIDILSKLNHQVTQQRPVATQDATGTVVRTFATIAQNLPALVYTNSGAKPVLFGGERNTYDFTVYLLPNASVLPQDWLIWTGKVLEVQSAQPQYSQEDGTISHLQVYCNLKVNPTPTVANFIDTAPGISQ